MNNSITKLIVFCNAFELGDDKTFAKIIEAHLTLSKISKRTMADEFEASVSTITRWANGVARPRPRLQQEIVSWIFQKALNHSSNKKNE